MIITGNGTAIVGKLKRFLHNHFRIKDLGNLKYFLGIEVPTPNKVLLSPNVNTLLIYLKMQVCLGQD
jgi:hypothetical protein